MRFAPHLFFALFSGGFKRYLGCLTVPAVSWQPTQILNQFWSQFYTARINLKTPLEYFTFTTDYVQKTAGGLGIEYSSAIIFDFFKTTTSTLFAATVPIRVFDSEV